MIRVASPSYFLFEGWIRHYAHSFSPNQPQPLLIISPIFARHGIFESIVKELWAKTRRTQKDTSIKDWTQIVVDCWLKRFGRSIQHFVEDSKSATVMLLISW